MDSVEEKEVFVLLDFQGEDIPLFQQDYVNFRMLNLNESKPIVQMGEDVYEGTYEDALGTNVYFEENKSPRSSNNIFECKTPISLQYVLKQSKVLKLKKFGTGKKFVVNVNPGETVDIQFKEDYKALLDKFEAGTLNIDDCVVIKKVEQNVETPSNEPQPDRLGCLEENITPAPSKPSSLQSELCDNAGSNELKSFKNSLNDLQQLVSKSINYKIKSKLIEEYLCQELLSKNDFLKWKSIVMDRVANQIIKLDIKKHNLDDYVDVEKSIEDGVISQSDSKDNRVFTKQEKEDLLSFKNFINVSPILKLLMLRDYLKFQKLTLDDISNEQLNAKDEDSYSLLEKFEVMKQFKKDLKSHIMLRLQDAGLEQDISLNDATVLDDKSLSDDYSSYDDGSDSHSSTNEPESQSKKD